MPISLETSARARLSASVRLLASDPPSMWSVRSKLANLSIASLITAKYWRLSQKHKEMNKY